MFAAWSPAGCLGSVPLSPVEQWVGDAPTVQGGLLARPTMEFAGKFSTASCRLAHPSLGAINRVCNYKAGGKTLRSGSGFPLLVWLLSRRTTRLQRRLTAPLAIYISAGAHRQAVEKEGTVFVCFCFRCCYCCFLGKKEPKLAVFWKSTV